MVETGFLSQGARCSATWVPATTNALTGPDGRPCVVMAHGYGCTRDSGLMPFAERFAAAGCDVLLFDYRGFGTSGGQPRQLVSHRRQRRDYHAAVADARSRPGVDPDRIVLWGTSYSGGHVVAVAAEDHRVAAIIAQGAAVDGRAILSTGENADPGASPGKGRRMLTAAVRDLAHAAVRRPPVLVDSVCARSVLSLPFNRPITRAGRITCPALFVIAERDTVAPASAVREIARRVGTLAQVVSFDCPHVDISRGLVFEESVAAQVAFLRDVLKR